MKTVKDLLKKENKTPEFVKNIIGDKEFKKQFRGNKLTGRIK